MNFLVIICWLTVLRCLGLGLLLRVSVNWTQELIYIIFVLKFVEPEAEVKLYIK